MFGIDPVSYHNNEQESDEVKGIRTLFTEILKRALEDLRYYKDHTNQDSCIQWDAFNHAISAQKWIDGEVPGPAITCQTILEVLGIAKSSIDAYLDRYGYRFDKNARMRPKTRRQANEIRFGKITTS